MNDQEHGFISIHTLASRFEADVLMDALEREGIPALLRSFEETPYSGLFVSQRGWGKIMVPEDFSARAQEIIQPLIRDRQSGGLYVDPSQVDPLLWERLQEADPETICRNAQVRLDSEDGAYVVPFLETELLCFPERENIETRDPNAYHKFNFQFYLVVLHHLLEAQDQGLSGKWISEKDIPGGQLFFRGPHKFPVDSLIEIFGSRPRAFRDAAKKLGGTSVDMGDQAYRLWAFPRIPLLFVFWEGDDEFEPALHIRFDETINLQLQALDTIWALVNVVCRSLRAAAGDAAESTD